MFRKKMMTRKAHFMEKLEMTLRKLWDVEFLLDQYKKMKEGFRVEYDMIKEMVDGVNAYEFLIRKLGIEKAKELMKKPDKAYVKRDELKDAKDLPEFIEKTPTYKVKEDFETCGDVIGHQKGVILTISKDRIGNFPIDKLEKQPVEYMKEGSKDDRDILTTLQNDIKGKNNDMTRLEKQMKDVGIMIEGDPDHPELTDPRDPPVNQKIANLRTVIDTLKEMVKKL